MKSSEKAHCGLIQRYHRQPHPAQPTSDLQPRCWTLERPLVANSATWPGEAWEGLGPREAGLSPSSIIISRASHFSQESPALEGIQLNNNNNEALTKSHKETVERRKRALETVVYHLSRRKDVKNPKSVFPTVASGHPCICPRWPCTMSMSAPYSPSPWPLPVSLAIAQYGKGYGDHLIILYSRNNYWGPTMLLCARHMDPGDVEMNNRQVPWLLGIETPGEERQTTRKQGCSDGQSTVKTTQRDEVPVFEEVIFRLDGERSPIW